MRKLKHVIILVTIFTFILTACSSTVDYESIVYDSLDQIYSIDKTKQLYMTRLDTSLNQDFNIENKYLSAWQDFIGENNIKLDIAITIYRDKDEIRLFGEFAFMEALQPKTFEILESVAIDYDFYIKRDEGVFFRSWALKKMHDSFGIEATEDYTDNFVQLYGKEEANELLNIYNNHKALSDKENIWNDLLSNMTEVIEENTAALYFDLDISKVEENLSLTDSKISNLLEEFFALTDWKAKYFISKEKLVNSTYMVTLDEGNDTETNLLKTFNFDVSRYVFPLDDPIDPR